MVSPGSRCSPGMVRKLMNVAGLLWLMASVMTCPECTSSAAMTGTVPWRMYPDSRRATRPGAARCSGYLRLRAPIAVFSSTHTTIDPAGFVQVEVAHCGGFGEEAGVAGAGQPAAQPMGFEVQVSQYPPDLGGGDPDIGEMLSDQPVRPHRAGFG